MQADSKKFDYIIIGAGSAGAVLAARLSANDAVNVLLLEAGGNNRSPLISIPMGIAKIFGHKRHYWKYDGIDEPGLPGRPQEVIHGKGLGGSSAINGMLFVRGNPGDYDEWAGLGNSGWSYADVLPYFKKLEHRVGGDPAYRGLNGPIHARSGFGTGVLDDAFTTAVQQVGHPFTPDYNGATQWGVSPAQHSITNGFAKRSSPLSSYLKIARRRKNLQIQTGATVTKILFERNSAVGVEYLKGGKPHQAFAGSEVILSAGSYGTPKLLMLSGIGPTAHLADTGINIVADLPGVGSNLQDHLGAFVQWGCTQPVTLYDAMKPWGQFKAAMHYAFTGQGKLSHYPIEVMAFLKSDPSLELPDLQFFIAPFLRPVSGPAMGSGKMMQHGYCISWCQLRPHSRGSVRLSSSDPLAPPRVLHNYLKAEEDRKLQHRAIEMAREFNSQDAFAPYRGAELDPGENCLEPGSIDQYLQKVCHTHFHPVGTAKMGNDEMAAVDDKLRVHGMEKLRVVDASIMPTHVGANTNIPTIMIAEKAADIILQSQ